jgi:hypothetical protein
VPSVPLSIFRPEIAVVVSEIPDDMIDNYTRLACIEMAEHTGMLEREYVLDAQECVEEYLLEDCEERIHMMHKAVLVNASGSITAFSGNGSQCQTICGRGSIRFEPPVLLRVSPAPATSVDGGIRIWASTAPTQIACNVDDVFYHRHYGVVVAGTLSKLLLIPGKNFSPTLSQYHLAAFTAGKTRQILNAGMNYTRSALKFKTKRFV